MGKCDQEDFLSKGTSPYNCFTRAVQTWGNESLTTACGKRHGAGAPICSTFGQEHTSAVAVRISLPRASSVHATLYSSITITRSRPHPSGFLSPTGTNNALYTPYRAVVKVYARSEGDSRESAPWALLVSSAAYCADKFYSIFYTLPLMSLTAIRGVAKMLTDHSPTCPRRPYLSLPGVFFTLHMDAK